MASAGNQNSSDIVIKVIKIANRLKAKLGYGRNDDVQGGLPQDAIEEADQLIATLCEECPSAIGGFLEQLVEKWTAMRDMPESQDRTALGEEVFTLAHEIKDISAMCGYELSAFFSESLRDYIAKTELALDAQRVIIQAHVDALSAVHKQGIKDDGGPLADELKKVVKIAVDKYS